MSMISDITISEQPPQYSYRQVTYAWDLLDAEEKRLMVAEVERLRGKGEEVLVYQYDTRVFHDPVQVGEESWSSKPSVWGEIWRELRDGE